MNNPDLKNIKRIISSLIDSLRIIEFENNLSKVDIQNILSENRYKLSSFADYSEQMKESIRMTLEVNN